MVLGLTLDTFLNRTNFELRLESTRTVKHDYHSEACIKKNNSVETVKHDFYLDVLTVMHDFVPYRFSCNWHRRGMMTKPVTVL